MFQFDPQYKQVSYERKLVRQILTSCGTPSGEISHLAKLNDGLSFSWFNQEFPNCPLGLGAIKLSKPIGWANIHKCDISKELLWQYFQEICDNNSDRTHHGLIFDHHNDNLSDMIIHTLPLGVDPVGIDMTETLVVKGKQLYRILYFRDFLKMFGEKWRPYG